MKETYKTDYVQIQVKEAVGKTIAGVGWSDGILLRFTDKTFLYINYDQYGDEVHLVDDSHPDVYDAKLGGLIDQAEFDRVMAAREAERAAAERKTWAYLKAKYGTGESV